MGFAFLPTENGTEVHGIETGMDEVAYMLLLPHDYEDGTTLDKLCLQHIHSERFPYFVPEF